MHFSYLVPALFAASGLAAKFEGFRDIACQNYYREYKLVTKEQLQDIVIQNFPISREESSSPTFPDCKPNKQGTFRFVEVPQWTDEGSPWPRVYGGGIITVYYDDTDTYMACGYHSSIQSNGYLGFCK